MTYKFEQFRTEITDPTIQVVVDSLQVQPTKMTISVDVVLTVSGASFGLTLDNIAVDNLEFQGYDNLLQRVTTRLQDYLV